MKGTVKSIVRDFGFIKSNEGEYFFHYEDFHGHWKDLKTDFKFSGDLIEVTFEPDNTQKGLRARNVRRTDFPNEAV